MWMLAHNKQKIIIFFQLANLVIYVISGFWLIPRLGINGAALTCIVTYFGSIGIITLFYKPKQSINILLNAINPLQLFYVFNYLKEQRKKS